VNFSKILGEKEGDRRLLLRVLAAGVDPGEAKLAQTHAKLESYEKHYRGRVTTYQRISLPLKSAYGRFVVLLYPHLDNESLPKTGWTYDGASLNTVWADQTDECDFSIHGDGRTRIRLVRKGGSVVAIR